MAKNNVRIGYNCDCGHHFEVPIGGVELHGYEFSCPACGEVHKFTDEEISGIMANLKKAGADAVEHARKTLSESFARGARGSKNIKYRSK